VIALGAASLGGGCSTARLYDGPGASASAANTLAFDVNYDRLNRYCCSFVDAESGAAPAMCSR